MIKPIQLQLVEPYIPETKAEGMAGFSRVAEYFGVYLDDVMIGFTSIQYFTGKAKFNNHYVFKQHRRKGALRAIMDFSIEQVKSRGIKKVIATCTKMSLPEYLRRGARVTKEYKVYTAVEIDL